MIQVFSDVMQCWHKHTPEDLNLNFNNLLPHFSAEVTEQACRQIYTGPLKGSGQGNND
jgi:hypothetical protein